MEENKKNIVDMDGMQKRADEAHKKHLDKQWQGVKQQTEEVIERNKAAEALLAKSLQREVDKQDKKLCEEMEAEKAQAIKEIEEKYALRSTKAKVAKQEDEDKDLKEMLRNLRYR